MSARLWSQKTRKGMVIDMRESIDDLLQTVDSTLIATYESKNLHGITLKSINEEYSKVKKDPTVTIRNVGVMVLFATVFSSILGAVILFYGKPFYVTLIIPTLLFGSILFFILVPLSNRLKVVAKCEPILKDFRRAVKALNPSDVSLWEYNEVTVRYILVGLAEKVLETEKEFDAVCMQKKKCLSDILDKGNSLVQVRRKLEETIKHATVFGLNYEKKKLFDEAIKDLERKKRALAEG